MIIEALQAGIFYFAILLVVPGVMTVTWELIKIYFREVKKNDYKRNKYTNTLPKRRMPVHNTRLKRLHRARVGANTPLLKAQPRR